MQNYSLSLLFVSLEYISPIDPIYVKIICQKALIQQVRLETINLAMSDV